MKLSRIACLIAAANLIAVTLPAAARAQDFPVSLVGRTGARLSLACVAAPGKQAKYGTRPAIQTTTRAENWGAGEQSAWRLGFDRGVAGTADGGRCETPASDLLGGDGVFSARIRIDGSVPGSTGVFTVAILPTPFDRENELDLFVINLTDKSGRPVVKFGKPGQASAIALTDLVDRWATVTMSKRGDVCTVSVARDGAPAVSLPPQACTTAPSGNRLVINSRSRNGDGLAESSVLIRDVSWTAR